MNDFTQDGKNRLLPGTACGPTSVTGPSALTRRTFLRNGVLALVGAALSPALFAGTAVALPPARRVLVVVFMRGAADGLNVVVPFRERAYHRLRRATAIAPPRMGDADSAVDLDGSFGLHPALRPLKSLYDRRMLAVVHATGSPDSTRSHFDAQDFMESAAPGNKRVSDGWLNRLVAARPPSTRGDFRAVTTLPTLPRSLFGHAPALAIPDVAGFGVRGAGGELEHAFEEMYHGARRDPIRRAGDESFVATEMIRQKTGRAPYLPTGGAQYPRSPLGHQLEEVARLIKADLGVEVAATDSTGWDTHVNQGGARGQMAMRLADLAQAITAFSQDMGDRMEHVLLLTMSEFGRRTAENGSGGTDHGHGNCNLVVGGGVQGGRVYGHWPGLEPEQLFQRRDLAVTTDFRDVFGEIVVRHLGCASTQSVFPGYLIRPERFPGFLVPTGCRARPSFAATFEG